MSEIWKPVPFAPHVHISNLGHVKRDNGRTAGYGVKITNYHEIFINRDRYKVHRLVMLVFHGESHLHVNHINGLRGDNRLENLEYVTHAENVRHAVRTGLIRKNQRFSKMNWDLVHEIRRSDLSPAQVSKRYSVSKRHALAVLQNTTWFDPDFVPRSIIIAVKHRPSEPVLLPKTCRNGHQLSFLNAGWMLNRSKKSAEPYCRPCMRKTRNFKLSRIENWETPHDN